MLRDERHPRRELLARLAAWREHRRRSRALCVGAGGTDHATQAAINCM
jgi:hypothetical protein